MKNVTTDHLRLSNRAEPRLTRHVLASVFAMYSVCSAVSAANLAISGGAVETWVDSAYPRIGTLAPRCAPDPKDGQWTSGEWAEEKDGAWKMKYKRPGDSMEKRPVVFSWPGAPLNEPVWVDLLTGDVRAARGSMVTCAEGVMFLNVPAYDSPCVITEHAAIDISSSQANNLTAR